MSTGINKLIALLMLWSAAAFAQVCPAGYGWYQTYTVKASQITGTLTNFPVLVVNNSNWATVANGGKVQNSNGYDIVWTAGTTTVLSFELVGHGGSSTTYDATTGNAEFWINVSSAAVGSVIYSCFGNSSINTYQGSDSGTWNSNYLFVHHYANGSTASYADSTSHALNGVNTSTTATTGEIDGGIALSGSSQYVTVTGSSNQLTTANFTLEGWFYQTGTHAFQALIMEPRSTGASSDFAAKMDTSSGTTNKVRCYFYKGNSASLVGPVTDPNTITGSTWIHYACKWDGTNLVLYRNGANVANTTSSGNANTDGATRPFCIGMDDYPAGTPEDFWQGRIDEVHMLNVGEPDAWFAAEFNNGSSQSGFWTIGTLTANAVAARKIIGD